MRLNLIQGPRLFLRALLIGLLLSACSKPDPPLRVALLEWPPYELAFWASAQGWYNKEQIQLLEYKTPAEVTRAFATGSVDVIAVTTDFALTLAEQYPETRIVLIIDASNGGDVVLSRTPVKDKDDLLGKTLAVEAGPLGFYMLARFRDHYELSRTDLKIEYIDIPAQVDHWQNSDIDLVITYEPNRSRLIDLGAVEIFTSREIPNEIVDVFVVKDSLITSRHADLKHFVDGWFKAVEDLKAQPPELFKFIAEREDLPPEVVREIFQDHLVVPDRQENLRLLSASDSSFSNGLQRNERVMTEEGIISGKIDRKALFTDHLLR